MPAPRTLTTEAADPGAVSLRAVLLAAFLVVGLVPALALSWLSFSRAREALTAEITRSLVVQAEAVQADLDKMLFERFENAIVWSRSELMEDLRFDDVDQRVANYLQGLRDGYAGVYERLDCEDATGRIVASSDRARIGRRLAPADASRLSVFARLADGRASLYLPEAEPPKGGQPFSIVADVPMPGGPGPAGGPMRVRLELGARQVEDMLDAAAVGARRVVVLDAQGRWVGASETVRELPPRAAEALRQDLLLTPGGPTGETSFTPWGDHRAIVGRGRSKPLAGFAGSGWTTIVLEPRGSALEPVSDMAIIFAGLLVAVLLATVVMATWISREISRPIAQLTRATRRYERQGVVDDLGSAGSRIEEIDVLGRAFHDMVGSVEQSRRELVRSSKLAMLGELAAALAHEVRTPLGILRSSAQILRRNPALAPEERELTGFIESETERLNRLLSPILDLARPREPRFVPCDLHALLERCVHMHGLRADATASVPITWLPAALDPGITADPELLMQVFFNLIGNAAQAAGADGRIEIDTSDDVDAVAVRCGDSGPGIEPALRERLFEPFVSGRPGGIGLGLAVARQLVAAHGGDITVGESHLGGAAFTVRLPRRQHDQTGGHAP